MKCPSRFLSFAIVLSCFGNNFQTTHMSFMRTDMYVDTHCKMCHKWTHQLRKTTNQIKGKPRQKNPLLDFSGIHLTVCLSALPTDCEHFMMTPISYSIYSFQQRLTVTH